MLSNHFSQLVPKDIRKAYLQTGGAPMSQERISICDLDVDVSLWAPWGHSWDAVRFSNGSVMEGFFGISNPPVWGLVFKNNDDPVGYLKFEGIHNLYYRNGTEDIFFYGFSSYMDKSGLISGMVESGVSDAIFVREKYRRKGFGSALISSGLQIMGQLLENKGLLNSDLPVLLFKDCKDPLVGVLERKFSQLCLDGCSSDRDDYVLYQK